MSNLKQFIYNNRYFLLIALLSLLLKIALILHSDVVNSDGALYLAAAKKYAQGLFSEGLAYYPMPFYPMLLAAMHFIIPDWILAGQLLTIISLVLVLWPLFALTQRLFNYKSALWTILLFAILPEFNRVSIVRDPLFLLFSLSALLFLVVCYQDRQFKSISGFVLFAVLAILCRIEGVLLFAVAPITMFFCWRRAVKSGGDLKRLIFVVSFGVVAIVLVLWGINVTGIDGYLRFNELHIWANDIISLRFFTLYQHLNQAIKELQLTLPGANYKNNLLEVTRHYAPLIYCIGLAEVLGKAILPTSLLAFLSYRWGNKVSILSSDRWLILLPWIAFFLFNILILLKQNFIQVRYFWIPIVLTLPWIGYGISLWWQERSPRKLLAKLVIALIVIAPLTKTVVAATKSPDRTIAKAGQWLSDYDQRKEVDILYNDRRLPLYADRLFEITEVRPLSYLCESAHFNKDVEIVALYLSNKRNENCNIQGFKLLKVFVGDKKTVVFLQRKNM